MFEVIDVLESLGRLRFLPARTPETPRELVAEAFEKLAGYREGAVYIGWWGGTSEWECHPMGDEIVAVLEGATSLTLLSDGHEVTREIKAGAFIIVPRGVWHRFTTHAQVKVLAVTPQPTEHSTQDWPSSGA